jgi:hypothetical protein
MQVSLREVVFGSVRSPRAMSNLLAENLDNSELISLTWKIIIYSCLLTLGILICIEFLSSYGIIPVFVSEFSILSNWIGRLSVGVFFVTIYLAVTYPISRWIWFNWAGLAEQKKGVLVAITLQYAFVLATAVPVAIVDVVSRDAQGEGSHWFNWLFILASFLASVIYFKYSTNLTFGKSLALNLFISVLWIVALLLSGVAVVILASMLGFHFSHSGLST